MDSYYRNGCGPDKSRVAAAAPQFSIDARTHVTRRGEGGFLFPGASKRLATIALKKQNRHVMLDKGRAAFDSSLDSVFPVGLDPHPAEAGKLAEL